MQKHNSILLVSDGISLKKMFLSWKYNNTYNCWLMQLPKDQQNLSIVVTDFP